MTNPRENMILRAWLEHTNVYRAGMGLPPIKSAAVQEDHGSPSMALDAKIANPALSAAPTEGPCIECEMFTEYQNEDGRWFCDACAEEATWEADEDGRLDNAQRVRDMNRER